MDIKNTFKKIGDFIVRCFTFVSWLVWSLIKGIATVITFLIIFAILAILISLKIAWIVTLVLLLFFVFTNRKRVATIIAALIAFALALALFNTVKYSLFPSWIVQKSSSGFQFHLFGKNFGATRIKNETLDNLTCYGAADLNSVSIKGPLTVYGQLNADTVTVDGEVTLYGRAQLNEINFKDGLTIYGKLTLNKGEIAGKTHLYGRADIKNCRMNDLFAWTKKITITSSTIKNIYIKKTREKDKEYRKIVIALIDTKIESDIVFESGNGEVILQGKASVEGKVVGGNVVKR